MYIWLHFPEAMLRICPGYRTVAGGEPVAQARRFAPPSEAVYIWLHFPEAMLRICPGYRTVVGGEPVARLSAARAGDFTSLRMQKSLLVEQAFEFGR
ncbi:hypothetical protein [Klebsiella oxytoca]|uniref:Uncharacterized protein n=1 Tax=Klebsiella oxytoca TaxID=571 RepID=A0A6B8N2Y8_KLEOX|nr:hypothetical protein [Klebsiella oxytoca]QGN40227.1 hypothetical protein GJ746_24200 [Klebsiella oxytoca]